MLESLRNSFSTLVENLASWLTDVLRFEDWHAPWAGAMRACLQVEPRWAEEMLDLQIRWHDGYLKVSEKLKECPSVYDRVSIVLLHS